MGLARFEQGGLEWLAEAPTADVVQREIAARLDAVESIPGAELIKRNLVRAVYRVPLADGARVIVKRYAVRGVRDPVKYLFKASRARAEWRVGRGLDEAGIPTAVPLAMAERHAGGLLRDAALVTREIPDALHLNAYVEEHFAAEEGAELRVALYDRLARLIRRMHAAGFVHNDLHGGNVLVNGDPATAQAHIIDLHSVTRSGTPSPGRRWFDLVKLLHSMRTCSTPQERVALCRAYEDEGGTPSGTELSRLLAAGRVSSVLEPRIERMERKRVRSRTLRSLERSSRFDVTSAGPFHVHHLRAIPAASFRELIPGHREALARGGAAVLKDAHRSALTRQMLGAPDGPEPVIVKEYRLGSWRERIKNVLRRPRPISAWIAGNGLRVRGFEVAEPLALVLRGRGAFAREAFLFMRDMGDDARADLVVLRRFAGALDADLRADKRRLLSAGARLFRRLHAEGVYHADLKAVNLFVREDGRGARIVLADYDRVEFGVSVSHRRRVKNLAQLSASIPICITLADRLRFFREYVADDPAGAPPWKDWFRAVIAECRRKIVVRMQPIE